MKCSYTSIYASAFFYMNFWLVTNFWCMTFYYLRNCFTVELDYRKLNQFSPVDSVCTGFSVYWFPTRCQSWARQKSMASSGKTHARTSLKNPCNWPTTILNRLWYSRTIPSKSRLRELQLLDTLLWHTKRSESCEDPGGYFRPETNIHTQWSPLCISSTSKWKRAPAHLKIKQPARSRHLKTAITLTPKTPAHPTLLQSHYYTHSLTMDFPCVLGQKLPHNDFLSGWRKRAAMQFMTHMTENLGSSDVTFGSRYKAVVCVGWLLSKWCVVIIIVVIIMNTYYSL